MSKAPYLKQVNVVSVPALSKEGELYTAEKRIQIVQEDEESFFMFYNYLNGYINNCKSIADIKVLNWLTANINYNTNTVSLNKFYKTKIKEYTGLALSSIERSISTLCAAKIIVRDLTCPRCGIYHVNPTYIWKGDRDKRKHKLKFILEVLQNNDLPDLEIEVIEDIQRYKELHDSQTQVIPK